MFSAGVEKATVFGPTPCSEKVEDRLRELLEELSMVGGCACLRELANPGGEILADARNVAKLFIVKRATPSSG